MFTKASVVIRQAQQGHRCYVAYMLGPVPALSKRVYFAASSSSESPSLLSFSRTTVILKSWRDNPSPPSGPATLDKNVGRGDVEEYPILLD